MKTASERQEQSPRYAIPPIRATRYRMVPALGCDDFLLDQSHQLLALSQAQIRNVAQIAEAVDHHHIDAAARPIDSGFHQTHLILDPQSGKTRLVIP